jgi:hypothetical protein
LNSKIAQAAAVQDNTALPTTPGVSAAELAAIQQSIAQNPATQAQIQAAQEVPAIDDNANAHVLSKLFYNVMQKFGVGGTGIEEIGIEKNKNYQISQISTFRRSIRYLHSGKLSKEILMKMEVKLNQINIILDLVLY